ncbi:MAG: OmpA family protein [Bacteroidota bacterium]|nr:OmpA family protein [Bacteroidota bacterium]
MKKCIATILFLSLVLVGFSQRNPDRRFVNKFYDASAFIYEENYGDAIPLLEELHTIDPDNANVQFKLGLCYLKSRTMQKMAEEKLEFASEFVSDKFQDDNHRERNAPPITWYFLGQAYRINMEFERSLDAFDTFLTFLNEKDEYDLYYREMAEHHMAMTRRAEVMVKHPVNVDMVNMGPVINSKYSDHSPIIDVHESMMIFTSKRPKADEPFYNQDEDLFVTHKAGDEWKDPERMDEKINTEENEASIGLSIDGDLLLFFRSEYNAGNIFSSKNKNDSAWSKPSLMTQEINTKNRETHACISPNNQSVYFTSDRPEGYGGLDIYVIRRLPNGEFGEPRLLGENINTEFDEETPFIHPDGQTLFFSSQGHKSIGGFDIFYSKMDVHYEFGEPVNLGFPINTTGDNVSYVMSMDGRRGYLSTYREDGYGDLDLYMINHKDVFITGLAIYEGTVTDIEDRVPEDVVVIARDKKTNTVAGIFRPNKYTGEYILTLRPGSSYDLIYHVNGRQMVARDIDPTQKDADQFIDDYQPVDISPVIVQLYAYHDIVLFENGQTEMTPSGNRIVNKMGGIVDTTEAPMVVTINYPPSHPLSPERFETVKNALIEQGVSADNIVAQGKIPGYAEIIYGLDISEGDDLFLDIDLAAEEDVDVIVTRIQNIFFEFDRYDVLSEYHENLELLAQYMLDNTDAVIEIAGHTDAIGSNEYNYLLSYRRAKATKDYLVEKGVSPTSLITKKYGKTDPIASNMLDGQDYPEGRKLNRRVEFKPLKQGARGTLVVDPIEVDGELVSSEDLVAQQVDSDGETFTIQIFALKQRRSIDYFDDLIGVKEHIGDDGFYRYYVGEFNTRAAAEASMQNLRDMGYQPFIRKMSFFE